MKRLDTFLEGLLDKSNKTNIVNYKDIIISIIKGRPRSPKSNFDARVDEILDTLESAYDKFSGHKVKVTKKPSCFITTYEYSHGLTLRFIWVQLAKNGGYWIISGNVNTKHQLYDDLAALHAEGAAFDLGLWDFNMCYEVPEDDMRNYLRIINNVKPFPSNNGKDEQKIIDQILS